MRLALRNLRNAPGYTLAAVTTLALAIGASTAIFSAVYAVLLKPMPIREPGQLMVGWGKNPDFAMRVMELSYLDIRDIGEATPHIGKVAAVGSSTWSDVLENEGEPLKIATTGVSGTFFDVLGASPQLGRVILPDDDQTTSAAVVVISHGLWSSKFGADPNILGRRIRLDERAHEIVGVMPAAFDYPRGTAAWKAVAPIIGDPVPGGNPNPLRNVGVLFLVGRLNHGVAPEAAIAEWSRVMRQILATSPFAPAYDITAQRFLDYHIGPARPAMWALLGAVGVLLVIACANVSGLMLTRVSLRSRDDAIRVAVGGTRGAIVRLWSAETVWLTVIGGVFGLLMCQWLIAMIVTLAPEGIPRLDEVAIDTPIAVFSIAIVALVTLLCGVAPIRHAGGLNLVESLNDGSRTVVGGRSSRVRSSLLVIQIGLAVVLLVASGLVVQSFNRLQRLDLGFDSEDVLRLKVEPRSTSQPVNAWVADLLSRVRALPDVETAGAVYLTPLELGSIGQGTWALAEGQLETPETANRNPMVNYQSATPEYFTALRIPLIRGRMFTDADRANAPRVVLISESTAAAFFPGQDALGKRIKAASFNDTDRNPAGAWRTVIGVVGNVRYRGLHEVQLDMYDPPAQTTVGTTTSIVVQLKPGRESEAIGVASAIQTLARQSDPRALISGISMLAGIIDKEIAPWRFSAWVLTLFAALAFALAMLGLFSLVSLDVASRRREFAIRMAVGATGGQIVARVYRAAGLRALAGVMSGTMVALAASRWISALLFDIRPIDARTYLSVIAVVVAVTSIAAYLPARRAAGADPISLLRRE